MASLAFCGLAVRVIAAAALVVHNPAAQQRIVHVSRIVHRVYFKFKETDVILYMHTGILYLELQYFVLAGETSPTVIWTTAGCRLNIVYIRPTD